MKWFKHYSNALDSESLADLMRDCGLEGYARYWILLEYLANQFDGETHSFRVPIETVRRLLRIRSWNELGTFAERIGNVRGMELKRNGNVFEIEASILLELQSKDFKKMRHSGGTSAPKSKTKIKTKDLDKETNTNKIIEVHQLGILWNKYAPIEVPKIKATEGSRLKNIQKVFLKLDEESWIAAIQRINKSDFLKGTGKNSWLINFDWFLKNYTKVIEGNYDDRAGSSKKRFGYERDDKQVSDEFNSIARGIDPASGKPLD